MVLCLIFEIGSDNKFVPPCEQGSTGPAGPPGSQGGGGGVVYVRWRRNTCPNYTFLVYEGMYSHGFKT